RAFPEARPHRSARIGAGRFFRRCHVAPWRAPIHFSAESCRSYAVVLVDRIYDHAYRIGKAETSIEAGTCRTGGLETAFPDRRLRQQPHDRSGCGHESTPRDIMWRLNCHVLHGKVSTVSSWTCVHNEKAAWPA